MTPTLSSLALRRARRARLVRRAFPLSLGLLLGLAAAVHGRDGGLLPRAAQWAALTR